MGATHAQRKALGAYGERVAAAHLRERGMEILAANWRCRIGEIDLVARDGETLVVCEVKTRRSTAFGDPLEAVTPAKAARLRRLTGAFLAEHAPATRAVRIDVVGVLLGRGAPQVTHVTAVA